MSNEQAQNTAQEEATGIRERLLAVLHPVYQVSFIVYALYVVLTGAVGFLIVYGPTIFVAVTLSPGILSALASVAIFGLFIFLWLKRPRFFHSPFFIPYTYFFMTSEMIAAYRRFGSQSDVDSYIALITSLVLVFLWFGLAMKTALEHKKARDEETYVLLRVQQLHTRANLTLTKATLLLLRQQLDEAGIQEVTALLAEQETNLTRFDQLITEKVPSPSAPATDSKT